MRVHLVHWPIACIFLKDRWRPNKTAVSHPRHFHPRLMLFLGKFNILILTCAIAECEIRWEKSHSGQVSDPRHLHRRLMLYRRRTTIPAHLGHRDCIEIVRDPRHFGRGLMLYLGKQNIPIPECGIGEREMQFPPKLH
jgi:hypothetical protein